MEQQSTFDHSNIKGLILDMDGVLWRSTTPIGNLAWIFKTIEDLDLQSGDGNKQSNPLPDPIRRKTSRLWSKDRTLAGAQFWVWQRPNI